jgi:competence ComEA-like helix-hairpin-helix protein
MSAVSMSRRLTSSGVLLLVGLGLSSWSLPSHASPPRGAPMTEASAAQVEGPADAGVVNLNTATADELQRLPRIGEEKALRIIAHRERTPFKSVVELGRVRGIGLKTLRLLKPWLAIAGPTTLRDKVKAPRKSASRAEASGHGAPVIL